MVKKEKKAEKEKVKIKLENSILEEIKQKLPKKEEKKKELKEEKKLDELLKDEEKEKENKEEKEIIMETESFREMPSSFNPEILVLRSGQKLEEIEPVERKREEREKKEDEKPAIRAGVYSAAPAEEQERKYQAQAAPTPVMPTIHEAMRETRTPGVRRVEPVRTEEMQGTEENRLYENARIEEPSGMPWQRNHEREVFGRSERKYKPRVEQ